MGKIILEDLIAEASAAAAMDFAASAMNSAIHKIIEESGAITRDEVKTIENLYGKVITEAIEEFVPSEDDIEELKKQLEAAGYKIVKAEEVEAEDADAEEDGDAEAPEAPEAGEEGEEAPEAGEEDGDADAEEDEDAVVQESADLAAKIAAKLEIL